MPSHTYTVEQLLGLRNRGIPMKLSGAPQKGVNHALHSSSIGRQIGSESRTLGRFHKFKPFHTHQPSMARSKIDFPAAPDEVALIGRQPRHQAVNGIPAEMEWRYRGRAGSEAAASSEPLSAPTGINAQQSEGFQRFYKAVISPTHVRVTAGGRIVPNTRGTSPMSKRPKDKADEGDPVKDDVQHVEEQVQQMPEGTYMPAPKVPSMPVFAFPPHPFYPPFPAGMPGIPMLPLPMGLGMPGSFPFPQQPRPPSNDTPFIPPESVNNHVKENMQNGNAKEPTSLKFDKVGENSETQRRAASEQVDRTKPFIMNGQAVYPFAPPAMPPHLGPGSHLHLPHSFLGHPNFALSAFPNALMGPPQAGMNHMFNPTLGFSALSASFQAPQVNSGQASSSVPANAALSSSNAAQPPSAPPISSIRPSEISRKQIEMLRGSLKYHEDQLLYNRHQIDEKEMQHTIQMLQAQIERFEVLNQGQLRFEESHYPKRENKAVEPPAHPRTTNRASHSGTSLQGTVKHSSNSNRRSDSVRSKTFKRKEPIFNLNPIESQLLLTDPIKKSTLPSKAALAPPFEPRSLNTENRVETAHSGGPFQWDGPALDEGSMVSHSTRQAREATTNDSDRDKARSFSSMGKGSKLGQPYLVGTLPADIDPRTARDTDYVYERELTQDESRSRYLYWGKAPSFTRKGLPKFDGKDFYPASPGNDTTHNSSPPPPPLSRRIPIGDPNVDYGMGSHKREETQGSHPSVPGQYASSFRRERQKPVKVTLRKPDANDSGKRLHANDKPSRTIEDQPCALSKRDKKDTMQADATRTKFLHTVLKRNVSANSDVLPGALTSATVQGVLPQYSTGYDSLVAASLSPNSSSPMALGRLSPIKSDDGSSIFITPASRKIGENKPPPNSVGLASLEQQFQSIVVGDKHDTAQWGL